MVVQTIANDGARLAFFRICTAFVIAVIVAAGLATISSTLVVLQDLRRVGAEIPLDAGLSAVSRDLAGFAPLYAVLIAIGFAIAFVAAAVAVRLTRLPRVVVFVVAGGVCLAVMLMLMEQVFFGVPVVAGARSAFGFALQMGAGALAALLYVSLTPGLSRAKG